MRPTYTPEAEAYREKVQAFLAEKLPANWKGIGALDGKELETFISEWRAHLAQSGYLAPGWPAAYGGGGLSALEQVIVAEEFTRAGVPTGAMNDVFGIQMLGNTLLLLVPKNKSATTCLESSPATTSGARGTANPTLGAISPTLG